MNKHTALALALEHARRGVPAFPICISWDETKQATSKAPLSGTHGHRDATTDESKLQEMFSRASVTKGELAVGLHPGPGGYVVLDVDDKGGKTGSQDVKDLEKEFGKFPETDIVATASGGYHIWLRKAIDELVGNQTLTSSIDIRGDAGWVVAPGVETTWGTWEYQRRVEEIPYWPEWLRQRLAGTGKDTGIDHFQEFQRAKCKPLDLAMLDLMVAECGAHGVTITNGFISVVRPGKTNGTSASIGHINEGVVKIFAGESWVVDGKTLPSGDDGVFNIDELKHWLQYGTKTAEVKLKGPELVVTKARSGKDRFRSALMNLDAIEQMKPPEFLIEGWLPRGALAMLYSASGVGKTFLAIDWMMHIAAGKDWQGSKVKKRDKVFYIVAEGAAGFGMRTKAWRQMHGKLEFEDVTLLPLAVNLSSGEEMELLLELIEEKKPQLVVIDTLARSAVGADENGNRDMGVVINNAAAIQETSPGCTVLILHHTGHGTPDRARGASAIYAALDASFRLDGNVKHLILHNDKQKEAEQHKPLPLATQKVNLENEFDSMGNQRNSLVIIDGEDLEGAEAGDEGPKIPAQALQVASALWNIPGHKAQNKDWMAKTGMASGMFGKWKKVAEDEGLVRKAGEGKNDPWQALYDPYEGNKITVKLTHREASS